MPLNTNKVPNTGSNRVKQEPLDPGTYPVRLVQILDLGLQKQMAWEGEDEKPPKYEIMLTYECLDEFIKDEEGNEVEDKPRWLHEEFAVHSLDSDLAKSTQRYFAFDPDNEKNGDFAALIGLPAMATVVQKKSKKGTVYNNIKSVSAMRSKEAAKAPELVNPPKVFDMENPDMTIFKSLPTFIQDKMKENLEYAGSALESLLEGDDDSSGGEVAKKDKKAASKPVSESQDESDDEDW